MNTDTFWSIIENARVGTSDCSVVAAHVKRSLDRLSVEEVLGFQKQLWLRLSESYRWDLWAIAYIVNGGCSDDGFEYFRGWLISQGREYFEAALREPRAAADRAEPDANECEDILYVASAIYKSKTGQYPASGDFQFPKEPAGDPWDEDAVQELYPDLYERFS